LRKIRYYFSMAEQIRTGLDWENVRVFLALARHGSLSAAARALSINHATVSRRIHALEAALGERLVERRPDGYVLTPAGTRALATANDMETAAAVLARGGGDDMPKGIVRINAPPSLSQSFLIGRLASLTAQHAHLDIDVATDFRAVSLDRRETDIAIRFGRPEDGDVIARPLATMSFGFYASPDCCKRIENGDAPVFVGFDEVNAHLPEAVWLARQFPRARIALRAGSQIAQAAAAKAGAGIALLPHFIGRNDAALVLCGLECTYSSRGIWLITRRQDRKDAAIRAVADFLARVFDEARELFENPA
jgi:molybdate transport repressor ModE-like protein